MKKESFYAPYYHEEFFRYLAPEGSANIWVELWCKKPTPEGTKNILVADYIPESQLMLPRTELSNLEYGIIDAHNHLDGYSSKVLLEIMDNSGIERIMNLSVYRERDDFLGEYRRLRGEMGDRLLVGASLPWHRISQPGALQTICDWIKEYRDLGISAVKIYKDLGLVLRDECANGNLLRLDDERFAPVWELCGELNMPIIIHQGDPAAFFQPIDESNERLEELGAHPDWHFYDPEGTLPSRKELLDRLETVMDRHPDTIFVSVHVGNDPENLANVSRMLDKHPNMWIDISARVAELGRQPNAARKFLLRYHERVLFGSDLPPHPEMYARYRRFLETDDDNFMYPTHVSGQGNWRISGINLPPDVVRKIYRENLLRIISSNSKDLIKINQ